MMFGLSRVWCARQRLCFVVSKRASLIAGRELCTARKEEDADLVKRRPGQHKTPITDWLWHVRDEVKKQLKEEELAEQHGRVLEGEEEELKALAPLVSEASVSYAFSKDPSLQDRYINPWGTIRVGRVLEDLDALAGNIAFQHVSHDRDGSVVRKMMLVTASIDRIVLNHRANLKDDISLSGKVSWVGSSSMEIKMQAVSSWTDAPWLTALFTFVARDRFTGRAMKINPLKPESASEKTDFEAGQARAAHRKELRKQKNSTKLMRAHLEDVIRVENNEEEFVSVEEAAKALFARSKSRLMIPAVGIGGDSVRISDTMLSNTLIMQPQQRNTAGRIFGGFLVRRAYELAFSTAYLFAGSVPKFSEIDEVVFRKPIDVGDLVHFESCVLFTSNRLHKNPSVHVEVTAHVISPEATGTSLSNTFNFTFEITSGVEFLKRVIPESSEQAEKIVTRYYKDLVQKFEDEHEGKLEL